MNVAPARPASTVVLLRPSPRRFDVFLVRRHDKVAFMGGAHVFPGGRVDEADRLDDPDSDCDGVAAVLGRMAGLTAAEAVGFFVAALRELFEEVGVLLARRRDGSVVTFPETAEAARFAGYRTDLAQGRLSLREVARREGLRLALDELALMAHWVTPEIEIKRFDTRFFIAAVPEGQDPVHDDSETTEGVWMDPADAIAACRREEIALPPPTWTTLRALERYGSVQEARNWARSQPVVRIQPGFIRDGDLTMLTLPGDATFPPLEGFETPAETRFRLADGRWKPVR